MISEKIRNEKGMHNLSVAELRNAALLSKKNRLFDKMVHPKESEGVSDQDGLSNASGYMPTSINILLSAFGCRCK